MNSKVDVIENTIVNIDHKVTTEDIFEGILISIKTNSFHFVYSKAIKKYKIDDVKHYIQDVNKTEADDSTPLMKGLIQMYIKEMII
jgi:hypothetical protein